MKPFLYIVFCFFIVQLNLSTQEQNQNAKLGIYGGINLNSHTADFYKLQGIPNCCPAFENGEGMGFNAGILYEYRLTGDFWLGARLGIITLDGELTRSEPTTIITPSGPEDGAFEHKLNGYFTNIGFEPSLIYNPIAGLLLSVGARLGTNIRSDFDQIETLTDPDYGTFLDDDGNDTFSRTRNEYSGEIPNSVSFQLALLGSVSYELPLNRNGSLLLAPEIAYYFPISEMVENTDWKCSSLRAGLSLKYAPIPSVEKEEIHKKEYDIDTVKVESDIIAENTFKQGTPFTRSETQESDDYIITTDFISRTDTIFTKKEYLLDGSIVAFGVDLLGNEIPNPLFTVEEYVSNRLDPLLNYVFFDNNSADIPDRYVSLISTQTDQFSISDLFRESTLDIYYNILNIIGNRMIQHPEANITLIGCNSGIASELNNSDLSHQRAMAVRNYLVNVWEIPPDRIKSGSRKLPEKASTPINEPDKEQENRRVEIYSDTYEILEPVFIEKIDRTANPPIVRFKPKAIADAGLVFWKLEAYQPDQMKERFTVKGDSTIPDKIDWELDKFQKIIPRNPEPLLYSLLLIDKKGNSKEVQGETLPINVLSVQKKRTERLGDYEIERFSLILFDFDKSTIEGNNQKIIDFIQSRVKPQSEIEIIGYTDRTGDDAYNKKLSERRAESTKAMLKRQDAKAQGIGEEALLYNNDIPEGRFYCRTVNIIVKTPIK